jgi:hypothetical protein
VITGDDAEGDLLVLRSTSDGQNGRVTLSASVSYELETATVPFSPCRRQARAVRGGRSPRPDRRMYNQTP